MAQKRPWRELAASAQRHRDDSIAKVDVPEPQEDLPLDVSGLPRELLTPREVEITETDAVTLLRSLESGEITCVEVTDAFLRRAALAQKLVNCVTELLPEQARKRAEYLDKYLNTKKKPVGRFHGLPISVKEHIAMKDLELNMGYCSLVGNIAEEDARILQILWEAGAVFYVRTTEPQTIMHLETASNLYGVTVNPYNRQLTAGGSSGGEGALLGLRGTCLGIGSDIGGSIRGPAANNGVFGFKPTSRRLPLGGIEPSMGGTEPIVGTVGPLSTSFEAIKLFMSVALEPKPWLIEPSLVPLPWRLDEPESASPSTSPRKLKVAILWDDGVVKPHPPVTRALQETASKLRESENIEVVDWNPYKHDEAWSIIASMYFCDGGTQEKDAIDASGEPWLPLSRFIVTENPHVRYLSIAEVWEYAKKRDAYQTAYSELWNDTATGVDELGAPKGRVDVIISPVGPGAAPPLECARYWGYTSQWNLLDYPALVFPVTTADPATDKIEADYVPRNEQDQYNYDLYEPEIYVGAPVSLQLIGRRYEDEKVIEAYDIIQKYL